MREAMEEQTKFLEATFEKAEDGSFVAIASTNSVDRHGEIVDNNGWDLKAFKKNPVLLWGHDHNEPAIGISKKTWVEGTGKKARLMITPVFHDVTEKARAVKALVEMGVIKTLSVGFKPLESPDNITFTKNELLEVSVVNVPANSDAMMLAYKSLRQAEISAEVMEEVGVPAEVYKQLSDLEEANKSLTEELELVKAASVNPKKPTEERLSKLKVIAKATDKVLEAENKGVEVDRRKLLKVIKRATELMTVAEKENLHG